MQLAGICGHGVAGWPAVASAVVFVGQAKVHAVLRATGLFNEGDAAWEAGPKDVINIGADVVGARALIVTLVFLRPVTVWAAGLRLI